MTNVAVVGPHDGETVLTGPIQMRILEDGTTTSHRLGIGEITLAPGTSGPPQHRHAQHDEGFYVVSGTARFTVGTATYDAPAGTLVMVPPGAPHTFANPGDQTAVLLNTFTPDLYVQYFRDLRAMVTAGSAPSGEAIAATMARYATVPATDFAPEPPAQPGRTTVPITAPTTAPTTSTRTVTVDGIGAVPVTLTDRGTGRPILLLHGGAGPQSVAAFADLLADGTHTRVLAPVHPGFAGTPRPSGLDDIRGLGALYVALLEQLDLTDVTVIGNSIGGWIAAEAGLRGSSRVSELVLVDAVGIDDPADPPVDFFALTPDEVTDRAYHHPDAFRIDPSTLPPEQLAALAGNREALGVYGGAMVDPGLAGRLSALTVPTTVIWGESDRIVTPAYGRRFAAAIPGARFVLLPATGHVPQIETPALLLGAVQDLTTAGRARELR